MKEGFFQDIRKGDWRVNALMVISVSVPCCEQVSVKGWYVTINMMRGVVKG